MQVQVKLLGMLHEKTPPNGKLHVADGTSIADVLATLDISSSRVQNILVNGSFEKDQSRSLSENDELMLLPPVAGG